MTILAMGDETLIPPGTPRTSLRSVGEFALGEAIG
jgi:hypothetical protein